MHFTTNTRIPAVAKKMKMATKVAKTKLKSCSLMFKPSKNQNRSRKSRVIKLRKMMPKVTST